MYTASSFHTYAGRVFLWQYMYNNIGNPQLFASSWWQGNRYRVMLTGGRLGEEEKGGSGVWSPLTLDRQ